MKEKFFEVNGVMSDEVKLDLINEVLDDYIRVQKHRWEKQVQFRKYKNAEEIYRNLNLLRKIKDQVNSIFEENP